MNDTQRQMGQITSTDPLFWKNVKRIVKTVKLNNQIEKTKNGQYKFYLEDKKNGN
jgi:hypothetical protein|tara:strand:- start:912 stop:1076 length:165 start_codon:yes stop_codon:yes gene_type:complete